MAENNKRSIIQTTSAFVIGAFLAMELAALAQGILIMFTMGQTINRFLDTFYFVFGTAALFLPFSIKFSLNKLLFGFIGIFILAILYLTLAYLFWIIPTPEM